MRKSMLWILIVSTVAFAADKRNFDTWTGYGGGQDSSQYSSLKQINKSNVNQLAVAWTYDIGGGNLTFGPIIVDRTMYVSKSGSIVALDATTGKELWTHMGGPGARGMNYWENKDRSDRRIVFISGGYITEINAMTGAAIPSFGDNGRVDPSADSDRRVGRPGGNPGRIYQNTIIVSLPASGAQYDSTPGDVRAYDVLTGKLQWTFHSIPRPGEENADTWPKEMLPTAGGVHNWNELTVDEANGIVFVPFGTARYDFYGGNRHGRNLYANSLVALDAKTGKRIWHFQMVHHDLWDYDLPAAPKLLTVRNNGRNVDVVAQPTKFGFLYVFNRKTGVPLWPIEERPVPKSDVPGEESWPTQPFPTKPPAFSRQSFTEKDINPYLPEAERASVLAAFKNYRNEGLFTPPSIRGTIEMPGHNGGSNWGRSAVDPARGFMYVVSNDQPTLMALVEPGAPRGGGGATRPDCGTGPYAGAPRGAGGGRGGGGAAPAARGAGGAAAPPLPPAAGVAAAGRGGAGGGRGVAAAAPAAAANNPAIPDFIHYNSPISFMTSQCNGLQLIGPPWSQLTAYDLNTGTIKWQVPDGEIPALERQGKTGLGSESARGGVVVTAGGLVLTGTTSDRKFRAYDQDTGKVLWAVDLPAASEGIPAVYQVDGREYIAVPVGGNGYLSQPNLVTDPPIPAPAPSRYMVFALPKK
ncbi:MAG TPA: PQQ-binding-like beta-propeller repeat protein [Terriglobia bacterium]|nr:PQQ-binding-like beta-propeller repeat protein [Terriglobia bacterium]